MLSEIDRLKDAGFIKEISTEATWVANPVMVPKKHTKVLRMCVDFTCLNKHCPKDHFPLPRIDQIIDSTPSKQPYPQYQKLAYGVFTTARKPRHYFSAHPIIVANEAPLSNILNNPEATGRVSLWGIELSPRDITYEKRKAIKSQVLPDFIAEWMELQNTGPLDLSRTWTMNFDGSKRLEGAGAGVILVSPEGDKLKYVLRMTFPNASNNEA